MTPNKQHNPQEKSTVTPEVKGVIAERREEVVAEAVPEGRRVLGLIPGIFDMPRETLQQPAAAMPTEIAANVINLAHRKEQQELSEQERLVAEALRQVEEARGEAA